MAARRAQTVLGMVLTALGTVSLSVGLARASFVPDIAGLEGWIIATIEGFVMLLGGILIAIFSFRPTIEPAPVRSATAAFNSRTIQPMPEPALRVERPAAAPVAQKSLTPRDLALFRLDEEIRDLTRRINKAGVMLATGQLSDEGYAHYVEDLKRQRGQLEASRVKLELNKSA